MKRFVFQIFASSKNSIPARVWEVVEGEQAAINKAVELTKQNILFAVWVLGDCIGDFS